jgi:pyruvate formate lyase activating enzyme
MIGRIHSLETFGTVDGPGIRFVLFMQGCALRCLYCHNPDTWDSEGGKRMTVDEVLAEIEPYVHYYQSSGGGITVSGGEPTLQAPFVAELFKACKERWNLHTALDSSGFCDPARAADLLAYTDLVLLDLKEMDSARHRSLTSQPNERILRFARHLSEIKKPVWIRCVIVPGLTDSEDHLFRAGQFAEELGVVEKIEVLPYHKMGVYKWKQLNRTYPLEHIREGTQQDVDRAHRIIEEGRKSAVRLTSPLSPPV